MLSIYDSDKIKINKWSFENETPLTFIVHHSGLLDSHQNKDGLTLFYGFLDQDTNKIGNAQFIAQQLKTHGIDALNNCYGSFIIIHCDFTSKTTIIANDALGDFAVHYKLHKGNLLLSEFPNVLVDKDEIEFDSDRLLHYFALTHPKNNTCFYKGVSQLNPGQYLEIHSKKITLKSYYTPPTKINYKLNSTAQLTKTYNKLMQEVISYQTKGQEHIGVMMSGGLDSTFVAASGLTLNKKVFTFSYVFPNMPEANESMWIDAMRSLNLNMHTFSGEHYWPLKSPWYISKNSPISNPYRLMKDVIYNQAQKKKITVLLSGVFADHLYTGYIYNMVDRVKRKPISAIKQLYRVAKSKGLKTSFKQLSPGKWAKKPKIKAYWLTKTAKQRLLEKHKNQTYPKVPHPEQHALVYGISTAQSNWLDNEYAFKYGVTIRHPYRDRRIVEFITSIPAWVLGSVETPKLFARKAAKDLLPPSIIRRHKITTLKPLFIMGVMDKEITKVRKLIQDPKCIWQKYVDEKLINKMLNFPKAHYEDADYMVLWQCISFELWRKALG